MQIKPFGPDPSIMPHLDDASQSKRLAQDTAAKALARAGLCHEPCFYQSVNHYSGVIGVWTYDAEHPRGHSVPQRIEPDRTDVICRLVPEFGLCRFTATANRIAALVSNFEFWVAQGCPLEERHGERSGADYDVG